MAKKRGAKKKGAKKKAAKKKGGKKKAAKRKITPQMQEVSGGQTPGKLKKTVAFQEV